MTRDECQAASGWKPTGRDTEGGEAEETAGYSNKRKHLRNQVKSCESDVVIEGSSKRPDLNIIFMNVVTCYNVCSYIKICRIHLKFIHNNKLKMTYFYIQYGIRMSHPTITIRLCLQKTAII